ncbi:MAG: DEAD/DEAH box helicase family protein [Desulfuromonadales bacterium]|nr:DEAD/DEAH box helicase family protein [Desulfuromonadales bacterium]
MTHLYQILTEKVRHWRDNGYTCEQFPAINEILQFQTIDESGNNLRFLRPPQFRALEVYWYLRLIEKTPHIYSLYKANYQKKADIIKALGIPQKAFEEADYEVDPLLERIKTDDQFVKDFKLEALRETLTLEYPSYILALAMGAGKTILVGAIIASEFAMALEYPTTSDALQDAFVENALVFAPGKTIIESLRELAEIPYDKVLPPRFFKGFAASVKLTFTPDGAKDIPVIRNSNFNIIVTNTEKIRIQKPTVRASKGWTQLQLLEKEKQLSEDANLRLQTIASLPHLAVFSDEAHHTYGQAMGEDLKKVRKTVDYLHHNSPNLICVVNTTGTPYYQKQPLKDVVTWYGLSEGIKDRILKDVSGNILAYSFDAGNADKFIGEVVRDFFAEYADVALPNGAPAKLAIYFPQTDDLEELRPAIEAALILAGQSPTLVLKNDSTSSKQEVEAFNRLNDPLSPHRVILLVNKGTEGWNCPSLFACALARKLKNSNNFVLQAATRCLREIPGNNTKARIYLSMDNRAVLDKQLQETYGETLDDLGHAGGETLTFTLRVRKVNPPPLVIEQILRTVTRVGAIHESPLSLNMPTATKGQSMILERFAITKQQATAAVLQQIGASVTLETEPDCEDIYTLAAKLSEWYRIELWPLFAELQRLYGEAGDVPLAHIAELARQIEQQVCAYEVKETKVEKALALIKPEGFTKEETVDGEVIYTAEIRVPKSNNHLILDRQNSAFGHHYTPYNFDSNAEKSFFADQLLPHIEVHPDQIEDIYFTGGLTDTGKTDFFVEYKDDKGHWRNYFPDFIIRLKGKGKKPGKCLIVEIKNAQWEATINDELKNGKAVSKEGRKAMAMTRWIDLNPERLKYQIIFADDALPNDEIAKAKAFVTEGHQ